MGSRLLNVSGPLLVVWASAGMAAVPSDPWTYHGEFHKAIAGAEQSSEER